MNSWQVGDVRISCIVEFKATSIDGEHGVVVGATPEEIAKIPWLAPNYVTSQGHLKMAVQAVLVDAPGLKLVVDTCIGNDKPRRMTASRGLRTGFLERLANAGWDRDAVDAVACTHLHIDHIGWNTLRENGRWVPTFPRARYLMAREEYEFWAQDRSDDEQIDAMDDSVQPLFDAGLVHLVEPDHRLSREVRLLPSPGHTPGHVSVAIESRGQRAVITGDMMHHPCQIARPDFSARSDSDCALALATRNRLLAEWADTSMLVVGTHFVAPAAGHVVSDGATYRFDPAPESSDPRD